MRKTSGNARQYFREHDVRFELPSAIEIKDRVDSVHTAIYLLFNEGYGASHHNSLIRDDLVEEALRLGNMLASHPVTALPETFALLALMCYQASRLYGRVDDRGNLLLLKDQDRARWNKGLIQMGNHFLDKASSGERVSPYHIEAAIAFQHCSAETYAHTDWKKILQLYDWLDQVKPDPVVKLNRLVVYAEVYGVSAALNEIETIANDPSLKQYYLLYATLGDWHARSGDKKKASEYFQRAQELAHAPAAKNFFERKMAELMN